MFYAKYPECAYNNAVIIGLASLQPLIIVDLNSNRAILLNENSQSHYRQLVKRLERFNSSPF